MAEQAREGDTLEAGPGAALDELVESQTGRHPAEAERGRHSSPGDVVAADEHPSHAISERSFWPVVTALSLLVIGIGFLVDYFIAGAGGLILLVSLIGWLWEPWTSE